MRTTSCSKFVKDKKARRNTRNSASKHRPCKLPSMA
ncbi:Uncharacterised protein [Vibrio cholerae]|nr:Uncharacterised protein [Vibrio cholerae]